MSSFPGEFAGASLKPDPLSRKPAGRCDGPFPGEFAGGLIEAAWGLPRVNRKSDSRSPANSPGPH